MLMVEISNSKRTSSKGRQDWLSPRVRQDEQLGEIANIIVGNAKTDFPEGNHSISVPSVVVGRYEVSYPSGVPIICIPCETDNGKMVIEIAMKFNPM